MFGGYRFIGRRTNLSATRIATIPPTAGSYGAGITGASLAVPAGAVVATPATLASLISSHPGGTSFALQPGTYIGAFANKGGNKYYGVPSNHKAVVFDGQTTYSSTTQPNGWGSNSLATSGAMFAFTAQSNNVFANMTVRRYRGGDHHGNGAIHISGANDILIQNVEFYENQYSGIRLGGQRNTLRYVSSHHNGAYAFTGSGSDHLLEFVDGYSSGLEGMSVPRFGDSNRGFSKFNFTRRWIVRNSHAHDFFDKGIWFDGDNFDFLIENNLVENIGFPAIFSELSVNGTIRGNTIINGGYREPATQAYVPAGIFSNWGGALLIENNTITGGRNGIILYQPSNRTFGNSAWAPVCGSVIRNNTISTPKNAWVGLHIAGTVEGCNPNTNPSQVTIENNNELGANVRFWLNGLVTPQQWAARGYS